MIETILGLHVAIDLFALSILFYIATKMAVVNDMTHQIRDILARKK